MIRLTHNTASPFVRKTMMVVIETGLSDRIQLVPSDPWNPDDRLQEINPLGKVPALVAADGTLFTGSALICEYLDSLHDGRKLFPEAGEERWRALRLHGLADGLLEAGVSRIYEQLRRPADKQWETWIDRQNGKIFGALDELERQVAAGDISEEPTIGELTLAAGLGYLDFRFPEMAWREGRAALASWSAAIAERPCVAQTQPFLPS
ncbi:MAG: glutathione S-transferase [Kiloniellales bacterium]